MEKSELAKTLKILRSICAMSKKKVADAAGMSVRRYTAAENGTVVPKHEELEKIADIYGITVEKIMNFPYCEDFKYLQQDAISADLLSVSRAAMFLFELTDDEKFLITNYRKIIDKESVFDFVANIKNQETEFSDYFCEKFK